jgi:hypothetical protein|tara:strand:- start:1283 stop:1444 length:162 start_codon:yes stop_codon:yes gene_type:complete
MNNKPIISGPGPDTFGDSSKLTTENFSIRAKKAVKRQDPGYAYQPAGGSNVKG